jgi:hypothetical protein
MQINGLLLQNILLITSSQPEFLVGSAPLDLQATVPDYMVPFAPILQKGEKPFAMFVDLKNKYDWVLKRVIIYPSVDRLIEVLEDEIVRPVHQVLGIDNHCVCATAHSGAGKAVGRAHRSGTLELSCLVHPSWWYTKLRAQLIRRAEVTNFSMAFAKGERPPP